MMTTKSGELFSLENLFQASKTFEKGGPYKDLLYCSPKDAKRDPRLQESGNLVGFDFFGRIFPSEPKTLFYNWLYIQVLHQHPDLEEQVTEYDAFTDISFNPKKSINCQAETLSVLVFLIRSGQLEQALKSPGAFSEIVYGIPVVVPDRRQGTKEKHSESHPE